MWFADAIFGDNFYFAERYGLPLTNSILGMQAYVDQLPDSDDPSVFKLHPLADVSFQAKKAQNIFDTIMSIQPREGVANSAESKAGAVLKIINESLAKIPEPFKMHSVRQQIQGLGGIGQPLNIFLSQEILQMQKVLTIVRKSLLDIKLALDGSSIMTNESSQICETVSTFAAQEKILALVSEKSDGRSSDFVFKHFISKLLQIFASGVPREWYRISWESGNLGLWLSELQARHHQYVSWLIRKPVLFWISGFFNPQGFLTAVRQEITRAHSGWSLDSVNLTTNVTKFFKEDYPVGSAVSVGLPGAAAGASSAPASSSANSNPSADGHGFERTGTKASGNRDAGASGTGASNPSPAGILAPVTILQEGVAIHGLYLEGASWDRRGATLTEPTNKTMYSPMPVIHVSASNTLTIGEEQGFYRCPVYRTTQRGDGQYVFEINLKCKGSVDAWVLKGLALLCSVDHTRL
jgi:dynein heavy chain